MMPLVILLVWIPCLLASRAHGASHLRHRPSQGALDKEDAKYWERLLQMNGYVLEILPPDENKAKIGEDCQVDGDCITDSCFFGEILPGSPGTCACNPTTNAGCEGDLVCYGSNEITVIQGVADDLPTCYLPFGYPCDDSEPIGGACVTGNCDVQTSTCGCNELTSFGCDTKNGEACLADGTGILGCRQIGDGSIGSDCFVNENCDFDICVFDPPATDAPGRCTCNPYFESGDGCEGDFECKIPEEIGEAIGSLVSVANFCKLPVGATCDPERPTDCLTENCDATTGLCACNPDTSFGCDIDNGEVCLVDAMGILGCDTSPCPSIDEQCMNEENFRICTELVRGGCKELLILESCPLQFDCGDTPPITQPPLACPAIDDPCMNPENFQVCMEIIESGCTELLILDSCPLQFDCGDTTPCPSIDEPCMNEENFRICTELVKGGCKDLLILESCPLQFQCGDDTQPMYPKCGGITGIPCEDKSLICYTGISNECDEDCGAADCLGECRQVAEGERCGGGAAFGFQCPEGTECVDEKGDGCSPNCGDADCIGICLVV